MTNSDNIFPAKILLFGEYTLINGSKALAVPFERFSAHFDTVDNVQNLDNALRLDSFYEYLKSSEVLSQSMDLDKFQSDLQNGRYLKSNIPSGYGIGSSGALCAATYAHYSYDFERKKNYDKDKLSHLKNIMATMEGFYHGKSSGFDCLLSLINKPFLMNNSDSYDIIDRPDLDKLGYFSLYDSGITRHAASFISGYLKKYEEDQSYQSTIDNYITVVNELIDDILQQDKAGFKNKMVEVSHIQYQIFADMIPTDVKKIWKTGLDTGAYYFKLCGAGGGGFFLVYSEGKLKNLPHLKI